MAPFLKPFAVWVILGALGLVALALGQDLAVLRELGVPPELPDAALRALIVLQPALLLIAGVGVGVALAGQVGLHSWLTDRLRGDPVPPLRAGPLAIAALAGYLAGFVVVALDFWASARLGTPGVAAVPSVAAAVAALLYGGISEELMMRYGLMTLIVWLLAQLAPSRPAAIYVTGIVLAAVLFGAGHLPAMAAIAPLTPLVILRTIGLNALLGFVYGWLYWRRGLEHAMAAHIATHLAFWTAGALL